MESGDNPEAPIIDVEQNRTAPAITKKVYHQFSSCSSHASEMPLLDVSCQQLEKIAGGMITIGFRCKLWTRVSTV